MTPLAPAITSVGLADAMAAHNDGVELFITHMAFGDGGTNGGTGYTPTANMTGLVRERVRVPVAGGERIASNEIQVEALLDTGPSFWMREVAFIAESGRPFAIWSDPDFPLGYKTDGVPIAVAYALALTAMPANLINVLVTGPGINLTMAEPFATMATALVRTQTHIVTADIARLSPVIANTWS